MCGTCGCAEGAATTITNLQTGATSHIHAHDRGDGHAHTHDHDHPHDHDHHHHDHEHDHQHRHSHTGVIDLERAVFAKNDSLAARNRAWFAGREILALNFVSSPGSGKTIVT